MSNPCECCGHTNYPAGVSCIPGVPYSASWCEVCIVMDAYPMWLWNTDSAVSIFGGSAKDDTSRVHFDREADRYFRGAMPLNVNLKLKGAPQVWSFPTRKDVVI